MTWAEVMQAAGGRTRGSNSHFVTVEKLTRQAKDRLAEIGQEDVSELFSLMERLNRDGFTVTSTTRGHGGRRSGAMQRLLDAHEVRRYIRLKYPLASRDSTRKRAMSGHSFYRACRV